MTTVKVVIRLVPGLNKIDWKQFLGINFRDWFVRIDKISTYQKDVIFYNDSETGTIYWSIVPLNDEEFAKNCNYKIRLMDGTLKDYDSKNKSLEEMKKIGDIYTNDVRSIGVLGIGEVIIDTSFVRTTCFKFIPSESSEFICTIWITAYLENN